MRLSLFILLLLSFAACNPCRNTHCENGGVCIEGTCNCQNPYTGKNCEIDACTNVICNNGGNCVSGICDCTTGYEGSECDSLTTSKFVGTFSVASGCGSSHYISVSASGPPSGSNVTFYPLDNLQVVAVVAGYSINIQYQQVPSGQTVYGNGLLSNSRDTINLSVTVIQFGSTTGDTCNFVLVRT